MGRSDQIEVRRRSLPSALRRLRVRATDVGATFVEYALIFSILTLVSIPAIQWLTDETRDESQNQAACVSERPPPASCMRRAVPPPPDPDPPGPPPEPPEGPPDEPPPPPPPMPLTVTTPDPTVNETSPWGFDAPVTIVDGNGVPVAGAQIRVNVSYLVPRLPTVETEYCTTDLSGTCTIRWDAPADDVEQVRLDYVSVSTGYAVSYSAIPSHDLSRPEVTS